LRERGWGSPYSDEGKYIVVLYKFMYFVATDFCWLALLLPEAVFMEKRGVWDPMLELTFISPYLIIDSNLKALIDYAQKPQRNCRFMNSTSVALHPQSPKDRGLAVPADLSEAT
jgi:hypothetical protein